jgi:hypothetical protein
MPLFVVPSYGTIILYGRNSENNTVDCVDVRLDMALKYWKAHLKKCYVMALSILSTEVRASVGRSQTSDLPSVNVTTHTTTE